MAWPGFSRGQAPTRRPGWRRASPEKGVARGHPKEEGENKEKLGFEVVVEMMIWLLI